MLLIVVIIGAYLREHTALNHHKLNYSKRGQTWPDFCDFIGWYTNL